MKHKHWQPGTLMAQAYRDIANEHNATVDALDAALAVPLIRVPFSDEVIEKMARAASDAGDCSWPTAIRAALAAGGLDYAPQDVAFSSERRTERASDEELAQIGRAAGVWTMEWNELPDGNKKLWTACAAAVRSRVEAPLLAEIRHLRGKLASAHQKTERQAAELTKLYHLRQGDAGERRGLEQELATERDKANRFDATAQGLSDIVDGQKRDKDSLRNSLARVTSERDTLRAQLEAVTAERDEARQEQDNLIFQRNDFRHWHANEQKKVADLTAELAALRQPTSTPTDAEVEALAKSMHATTPPWKGWNEMIDAGRESWRNSARAAFAHIGRVPVAWELDVTADVIEVIARSSSRQTRAKEILDLCRSRIKPVYECKECAKNKSERDVMYRDWDDCRNRMLKVRLALNEGDES